MAAEVRPEATADLTAEDDHPTDDGISSARDPATPPDLEP
jgi:hypothetical protein